MKNYIKNKQYVVKSPDDFPITMEFSDSPEEAWEYFKKWKQRFAEQGYYSTIKNGIRVKLSMETLKDHCTIAEYDEE